MPDAEAVVEAIQVDAAQQAAATVADSAALATLVGDDAIRNELAAMRELLAANNTQYSEDYKRWLEQQASLLNQMEALQTTQAAQNQLVVALQVSLAEALLLLTQISSTVQTPLTPQAAEPEPIIVVEPESANVEGQPEAESQPPEKRKRNHRLI